MKPFIKLFFTLILGLISISMLNAQPPGGRGPRPGGGPEEMMKREKQAVFEKVEGLSDDQKLLIDGIYSEFTVTLRETFQAARESGDRESAREKMMALREEKDGLIADVLNEEQFETYKSISSRQRDRQKQRRENNSQGERPSN